MMASRRPLILSALLLIGLRTAGDTGAAVSDACDPVESYSPYSTSAEHTPGESDIGGRSPATRVRIRVDGIVVEALLYVAEDTHSGHGLRFLAVDAHLRKVLWSTSTEQGALGAAVPRAAMAVLRDAAGVAYRAYVGNDQGLIWRLDLGGPVASPRASLFADLRSGDPESELVAFPHSPDLYAGTDELGSYVGIVLGGEVSTTSGRRVDLFELRDRSMLDQAPPYTIQRTGLAERTDCTPSRQCEAVTRDGWWLPGIVRSSALAGSPLIDGGRVFLMTYSPESVACAEQQGFRFLVAVSLSGGHSLLEGDHMELGIGPIAGPELSEGEIRVPGLKDVAIPISGTENLLGAVGQHARVLYRIDLLLDRDR